MTKLKIRIEGTFERCSGKYSKQLNKMLTFLTNVITTEVGVDVEQKAKEYAAGIDSPPQKVSRQADHPIGKSDSEYSLTGQLEQGISMFSHGKATVTITSAAEHSSHVEFGTGVFGPTRNPIVARGDNPLSFVYKGKLIHRQSVLGQAPNPFLRGSVWYTIDNPGPTVNRIQKVLDKL